MSSKKVEAKTSELVIFAIYYLDLINKNEKGYTAHEITNHISTKHNVDYNLIKPNVKWALLKETQFGIVASNNGRYKLEDVPEPPFEIRDEILNDVNITNSNNNKCHRYKRKQCRNKMDKRGKKKKNSTNHLKFLM